jgi:hypothetical protein
LIIDFVPHQEIDNLARATIDHGVAGREGMRWSCYGVWTLFCKRGLLGDIIIIIIIIKIKKEKKIENLLDFAYIMNSIFLLLTNYPVYVDGR